MLVGFIIYRKNGKKISYPSRIILQNKICML